ncbi:saccharopine dehydrogenase-like oxidoreductase isoform X2 [Pieris rapae]|uniref:saccharopine dehydrogenase-like oxidoreductase isoform X2 n=1 Tax=Pieris rapae TaxID=64459 RepID=UPI001E27BAD4|nr:saccharopine dehydrogenase-like oxidoreductase isoform X2 [Pieris rapae]
MGDKLDIIIFGASGYTGRFVIAEMIRICRNYPDIRWAIAGRSKQKLEAALLVAKDKAEDVSRIQIIIADAEDEESLKAMCRCCKLVMNCSGPFMCYGEALVKAAIECKIHYIDVCSEFTFLETIKKYDAAACDSGVLVINACGLGCLTADLGVLFLQQQFQGTLNSVEAYLTTQPEAIRGLPKNVIRNSTWEALIFDAMAKPFWGSSKKVGDLKLEPELKTRIFVHKRFNRWCVPFPGSEEIVVQRTQNYFKHSRPVQFKRYHSLPSLITSLASFIGGFFILFLLKVFCLSSFFLKYPRIASLGLVTYGDPDEKIMERLRFDYLMVGVGWRGDVKGAPRDEMIVEVYVNEMRHTRERRLL